MKTTVLYPLVFVLLTNGIFGQSDRTKKEETCTPGSQIGVDCNTCTCFQDGATWVCTRIACQGTSLESSGPDSIEIPRPTDPLLRNRQQKVCEPGSVRKVGCKTCHCSIDGIRELCVGRCRHSSRLRRNIPLHCKPNSEFKNDCNHCVCSSDGRAALCSSKGCSS